jgi:hypothetical protein
LDHHGTKTQIASKAETREIGKAETLKAETGAIGPLNKVPSNKIRAGSNPCYP